MTTANRVTLLNSIILAMSLAVAGAASALPMVGTILGGTDSYLHCGATPDGCGNSLSIDAGQTFGFDLLDDKFIYTNTPVEFSLNGGEATLNMLELFIRVDQEEADSFRYGFMAYSLDGDNLNGNSAVDYSKFWFDNMNLGLFNSIEWDAGDFSAYAWGSDDRYSTIMGGNSDGLGITFAFRGGDGMGDPYDNGDDDDDMNGDTSVPEPGTLALLGLGLVGIAFRRRGKANV